MNSELARLPAHLIAPAKLTLSLKITGVRADGYHEIDATMTSLDLCDELTLTPGDSLTVTAPALEPTPALEPALGPTPSSTSAHTPTGVDNLVVAALRLVGLSAAVELRKRIPVGAGLGGGSADAAAILRWFNDQVRDQAPDRIVDVAQACQLGADVGFCLAGGRATVRGIGEQIKPLPYQREQYTLLTPSFGVSSAQVYQAWDRLAAAPAPATNAPGAANQDAHATANDLEPAALAVAPELAQWRAALADQTGQQPTLAGSGSTWFVKGHHPAVSHKGVAAVLATTTEATPPAAPLS